MSAVVAALPTLQKAHLSTVEVLVNGRPLSPQAQAHLTHVTVETDTRLPAFFELRLIASQQLDSETEWIDDPRLFKVGNQVTIRLGYENRLTSVIVGEITGLEPEFSHNHLPILTVRGYDRRHRLQRGRKTRSFVNQKDSNIAAQIAREAGLNTSVTDSRISHPYVLQANQTDWEFLQERAQHIHYEVVIDNRTLTFRPVNYDQPASLTLSLRDFLLEFYPCLSSVGQVNQVDVRFWDSQAKKSIQANARTGDEGATMGGRRSGAATSSSAFGRATNVITHHPAFSKAEATQMAKAQFQRQALEWITGEGTCLGVPNLGAGTVIRINEVGQQFSGLYYVTSVKHCYTQHNYLTHFTVRRNAS